MKLKVINANYVYAPDGLRLNMAGRLERKPWHVYGAANVHKFRTHAKAVAWATKRVREGRK